MIDFDAFRAEHAGGVAPQVKVGGVTYDLPPALPAVVALDILRARRDKGADADLPPELINDICDALFGRDVFRKLLIDNHFSIDDLGMLITQIMSMYDARGATGQTLPNREARRRSKRSR